MQDCRRPGSRWSCVSDDTTLTVVGGGSDPLVAWPSKQSVHNSAPSSRDRIAARSVGANGVCSETLDSDERRCLVLTHCAQDIWRKAGKEIENAPPIFENATEWRTEIHVLDCGFQSIEVCFTNTYAMKCPVMIATTEDGPYEVLYIAVMAGKQLVSPSNGGSSTVTRDASTNSCTSAALDQSAPESDLERAANILAFTTEDVCRRLTDSTNARVVFCGEGPAAIIAQKLTCVVWNRLLDVNRLRLRCVSIGCACLLHKECFSEKMATAFTSLISTADERLREWHRERLRTLSTKVTAAVGRHLVIRNDSGNPRVEPCESVFLHLEQDLPPFESHLALYFSACEETPVSPNSACSPPKVGDRRSVHAVWSDMHGQQLRDSESR